MLNALFSNLISSVEYKQYESLQYKQLVLLFSIDYYTYIVEKHSPLKMRGSLNELQFTIYFLH